MTFQSLPGFRDFLPDEMALRLHIMAAWRRVALRYGFEEYDGPPLEPLELYQAKSGTELVGQLFDFVDKGGRAVTLRPEMTPTFARMVSARANGLRKPIRWFSVPQLFRYEKPQRGRLREHFQLNCDLVGEPGPLADAELISLAIDSMKELGLTAADFRVRLSDRRLLADLLTALDIPESAQPAALKLLDKLGRREAPAAREAFEAAGGKSDRLAILIDELAPATTWPDLVERALNHPEVAKVLAAQPPIALALDALTAMGQGEFIELDLTIVRGLDYYTGTVFELFDRSRSLRAICGGGRYDTLLEMLGGVDLPALGFGMGDVVLGELLRERGLVPEQRSPTSVFVAAVGPDDLPDVLAIVQSLRDGGIAAEFALHETSLGKQLRHADARGARLVVVVGPDDRELGVVQVKDLGEQQQTAIRRARLVEHCRETLNTTEKTG